MNTVQIIAKTVITTIDCIVLYSAYKAYDETVERRLIVLLFLLLNIVGVWI